AWPARRIQPPVAGNGRCGSRHSPGLWLRPLIPAAAVADFLWAQHAPTAICLVWSGFCFLFGKVFDWLTVARQPARVPLPPVVGESCQRIVNDPMTDGGCPPFRLAHTFRASEPPSPTRREGERLMWILQYGIACSRHRGLRGRAFRLWRGLLAVRRHHYGRAD